MLLFVFPECVCERLKVNADLRGNRPRVCTFAQVRLTVFWSRCWGRLLQEQVDLTSTLHAHTNIRYPPSPPRPRSTHHHSGDANRCAAPHWACLRQAEHGAPPQGLWEIWFMMPVVLLTTNFNSYATVPLHWFSLSPSLSLCFSCVKYSPMYGFVGISNSLPCFFIILLLILFHKIWGFCVFTLHYQIMNIFKHIRHGKLHKLYISCLLYVSILVYLECNLLWGFWLKMGTLPKQAHNK